MKINILTLIPCSYGGGAEKLIIDQIKYHNTKKFNYFVIALRKGNIEHMFSKYPNYFCLNSKSRFNFKFLFLLNKYIKNKKIKILHSHLSEADIYGFFLKILNPKLKWISTRHNTIKLNLMLRITNTLTSFMNTRIIAVSEYVKKFIVQYEFLNPNKITTILNGIDTNKFKNLRDSCERKKYGLTKKDFIVGMVGRLDYQKGHEFLFEAISKIKNKTKNIKVLVIGEGELKNELKNLCKKMNIENKIIFGDFSENVEKVYNCFDLFCLPSRSEGLPLVLLEAMACEKMCLCSDIANNREVICHKKDGILLKMGNVSALAKEIYFAYENQQKQKEIGRKARNKIKNNFEFSKKLKKIEKLYLDVLK